MKILYGVVGEGLGHATRSTVIINHLKKNHEVRVITSGEALSFLQGIVPKIHSITGLRLVCKNNQLKPIQTFIKNLINTPFFIYSTFKGIYIFLNYKPDVVVADFESLTGYLGKIFFTPIINVDNIHFVTMTKVETTPKRTLNLIVTKLKTPFSKTYLIPAFHPLPITDMRAKLFPPIVREEVKNSKPTQKEHIVIYQKPENIQNILPILKKFPNQKFIVYGYDKNKTTQNIQLKKTAKKSFIDDLASSKAVISRAGFSLISEALILHKPLLCIPIKGHFEQETNAFYIEKLGYGKYAEEINEKTLKDFISSIPIYTKTVKKYVPANGNLLSELDTLLK